MNMQGLSWMARDLFKVYFHKLRDFSLNKFYYTMWFEHDIINSYIVQHKIIWKQCRLWMLIDEKAF